MSELQTSSNPLKFFQKPQIPSLPTEAKHWGGLLSLKLSLPTIYKGIESQNVFLLCPKGIQIKGFG